MKDIRDTQDSEYTKYLLGQRATWKRWLDVQAPYRHHIRKLKLGRVLEVGCGIGRNLINLGPTADHCGIDHNEASVSIAQARGLNALTVHDFLNSALAKKASFDTLLMSHLLEHLTEDQARQLLLEYIPYISSAGRVMVVTPQQAGFASDSTHLTYFDHFRTRELLQSLGLKVISQYSFPLPLWAGRHFKYNEFVCIARI